MTRISNHAIHTTIRLGELLSLIFFVLVFLPACRQDEHNIITIVWTNKQATSIDIPKSLFRNQEADSIQKYLNVRLKNSPAAMLGDYQNQESHILFQPVIALSRGSQYEVFFGNDLIGSIDVPIDSAAKAPVLLAVYPTTHQVPENLLKFYFQFSAPMREGEALRHIVLLNSNNDTLPGVFLDLQPELWNRERTVLTLWLDPGRIKRDLIPNRKMGNPLVSGQRYTLVVSNRWKDMQDIPLRGSFTRSFMVAPRDSSSPQIKSWTMTLPEQGTLQPIKIILGEPLDYFLLNETIRIFDEKGKIVEGSIMVSDKETSFSFRPAKQWLPGHYSMQVAPKLEDLAGNNLERLFDRDLLAPKVTVDKSLGEREFVIGGK